MKYLPRGSASWWRMATLIISAVTLLLAFFVFVPVSVALSAGIAGISLALFTPLVLLDCFLAVKMRNRKQVRAMIISLLASIVALLAMAAVQLSYIAAAHREQVSLSFDPLRYLEFTGDSIKPSRTFVYKELTGQSLHIAVYDTHSSEPAATVVLLHGGGWQYGSYLRTNNWPKLLTEQGYRVISIDYRLATTDHATWDKAPQDVSDAITYIKKNSTQLGVKPDKIALLGQSAGGHLALLEAYKSQSVQAVVGLYAPTDLAADYRLSIDKASELAFLGGKPERVPDRYKAVSAQDAVTGASPPTLLIQGLSDDLVNYTSSMDTSSRLRDVGVRYHLVLLPYTGHSFENQVGGFATQISEQVVVEFLASTLLGQ